MNENARRTHSREINTSRLQMQIHQVIRNPTLKVPVNMVRSDLLPHIDDLQETICFLLLRPLPRSISDRLIRVLVLLDASQKIRAGIFAGHTRVVGVAHADFELDVCCYDSWVGAFGFEEQEAETGFFGHAGGDLSSSIQSHHGQSE